MGAYPQEQKPIINHIRWIGQDGQWHSKGFLPLYNHILKWDTDMKCPAGCKLAYRCHPMVQDGKDRNTYHKLCTLTVIRAGLIREKDLI